MFTIVKRYPMMTFVVLNYLFLGLGWWLLKAQLPLTPLMAALIVVPITGGWQGLKSWASRIVRWRVGVQWYAAALLMPAIATATAAYMNIRLGASYTPVQLSTVPSLIPELLFVTVFIGLGEEPGFRGFAVPQLQQRFSGINSALILSVIGVIWHVPLFITGDSPWIVSLIILFGYILFVWLFNNTNGSVVIPIVLHMSLHFFGPMMFGSMFTGADLIRYTWLLAASFGIMAALVLLTCHSRYMQVRPAESLANIVQSSPNQQVTQAG